MNYTVKILFGIMLVTVLFNCSLYREPECTVKTDVNFSNVLYRNNIQSGELSVRYSTFPSDTPGEKSETFSIGLNDLSTKEVSIKITGLSIVELDCYLYASNGTTIIYYKETYLNSKKGEIEEGKTKKIDFIFTDDDLENTP